MKGGNQSSPCGLATLPSAAPPRNMSDAAQVKGLCITDAMSRQVDKRGQEMNLLDFRCLAASEVEELVSY